MNNTISKTYTGAKVIIETLKNLKKEEESTIENYKLLKEK